MEPQTKKARIVIVEDNVDLAEIYKTQLEMNGYQAKVAYDGIAALYLIQQEMPDLVLLDLMVPAIAGDQILLRMRSSDWGKHIPVVIISNLNEHDAPAGIREMGISGYVVKAQFSLDQFSALVESMLKTGHAPMDAAPQAPAQ